MKDLQADGGPAVGLRSADRAGPCAQGVLHRSEEPLRNLPREVRGRLREAFWLREVVVVAWSFCSSGNRWKARVHPFGPLFSAESVPGLVSISRAKPVRIEENLLSSRRRGLEHRPRRRTFYGLQQHRGDGRLRRQASHGPNACRTQTNRRLETCSPAQWQGNFGRELQRLKTGLCGERRPQTGCSARALGLCEGLRERSGMDWTLGILGELLVGCSSCWLSGSSAHLSVRDPTLKPPPDHRATPKRQSGTAGDVFSAKDCKNWWRLVRTSVAHKPKKAHWPSTLG
ncbi:hypothetical protein AOLI_G00041610 [Acnodon oligacanthus]